ncbi:hypothetical protein SBD_7322 [Streptomyces bottropensis ATCC 25435]|uniref:Uncharacterized protein n=1 Tax=Streptomyces bottropensis ATCC 25435 TaxID=1054862 RepID=M3ERD3_9ACTN|nr:hypothetical protein SBD_7322 [Streptomyces bottropensis ATCC 25435]
MPDAPAACHDHLRKRAPRGARGTARATTDDSQPKYHRPHPVPMPATP